MRELNISELSVVGGGFTPPAVLHPYMDYRIALTTFRGMGYVGSAFTAGYTLGQLLNTHTGIQQWLSNNIDTFLNSMNSDDYDEE